jgi:5-methylthioadenosine/S-adenosylhomocysteine deaminase
MRTVIRDVTAVTMDEDRTVHEPGRVVVEDGLIVEVGPDAPASGDVVVDGRGRVAMPGLVNGHAHSRPARALGDGLALRAWHDAYPDNVVREMVPGDARLGALMGCGEMLLGGTTTVLAMPNIPGEFGAACVEAGIRALVAAHASDTPALADCCDSLESNLDAVVAGGTTGRVRHWFGYEHQTAATDDLIRAMVALAGEHDTGITSHLCEDHGGVERHVERYGCRPVERYAAIGALTPRHVFAHGNWLTEDEIDQLVAAGCAVVHNPTSNMRLGTGVAPVVLMRERGLDLALGTDGPTSTYRLDMFEVMRATAMLARVTQLDAKLLPAGDVLALATRDGAAALGLGGVTGSLEAGKAADVILVDTAKLHLAPRFRAPHDNLEALLVFSAAAADVTDVWVDGHRVVHDRGLTTFDEAAVLDGLAERAPKLAARFPEAM